MLRERVHRHEANARLTAFLGVLGAVAVAIAVVAAVHAHFARPGLMLAVAGGLVLFKLLPLPPQRGRIVHSFTLVEVAVVLGVATLPAADALVAASAAAVVVLFAWPRCWHKAVFNAAEIVAGAAVAVAVADPTPVRTLASVGLLALAGLSYAVVSTALMHVVLVVAQGAGRKELRAAVGPALLSPTTSIPLGILAAAVADRPFLLILLGVPVVLLQMYATTNDRLVVERERAAALAAVGEAAVSAEEHGELVDAFLAAAARVTGGTARLDTGCGPAGTVSVRLAPAFAPDAWVVCEVSPQRFTSNADPEPALRGLVSVAATGLDNLALRGRLHDLATTDELTGLGNRREFVQQLEAAATRARRGRPFGVLFVDLDRFKAVNDVHGHATGDAVLRGVAERLRDGVRASDRVFRLAGDEFTVIADGVADDDALAALGATLAERVCGNIVHGDATVPVSVSVGGAVWTPAVSSAWALVSNADQRMYGAKAAAS